MVIRTMADYSDGTVGIGLVTVTTLVEEVVVEICRDREVDGRGRKFHSWGAKPYKFCVTWLMRPQLDSRR